MTSLAAYARAGIDGAGWYDRAHDVVLALAGLSGQSIDTCADIVAITSPRVQLRRNVQLAHEYLVTGRVTGALPGVRAALAHYSETGEIRGPKTSAFARALKGDRSAMVIDVWVIRALRLDASKALTRRGYRDASARMVRAAKRFGVLCPRDFQAAVWTGVRRAHGRRTTQDLPLPSTRTL